MAEYTSIYPMELYINNPHNIRAIPERMAFISLQKYGLYNSNDGNFDEVYEQNRFIFDK